MANFINGLGAVNPVTPDPNVTFKKSTIANLKKTLSVGNLSTTKASNGVTFTAKIKNECGQLVLTASNSFKAYYKNVLDAEKLGKRESAINPAQANKIFKELLKARELSNAVWLLRNGADNALISSFNPTSAADSEFMNVLTAMSQHHDLSSKLQPKDLDKVALDLGYGYKTANLQVIQSQLDHIKGKVKFCDLAVPNFKGISHHEIKEFLKKQYPQLENRWNDFLKTFPQDQKEKFLQADSEEQIDLLIPDSGQAILQEIQQKIAASFTSSDFYHIALAELVDSSDPQWVIVRSTGREDSKDNANAGGNDSIPFIAPQQKDISKAIGNVVASYFGAKSIIQRLQAKDKTLFTQEPFMPVLLQKMICEENAGGEGSNDIDIPCSGVLFTREQGKDPNVVTINAARGSNEGVVASQVVTDTYQVHPKGVYSTIRVQPTRFVHIPNENQPGFHVGPVLNKEKKVSHGPALSSEMVQDLSSLARELGKVYATPDEESAAMDMEFTVKVAVDPSTNKKRTVIYPLQIRPLQETKKSNPSFLNQQQLKQLDPTGSRQAKGATLLDGGSEAKVITNGELETIICDDITEALHKFQHHPSVKDLKAIIIRQPAPLTSHECVTLRPKGVPVIVIEDEEAFLKAQNLITEAERATPVLFDSQRAVIYKTENNKEVAVLVKNGLISYPGPVELSMKNPSVMSLNPANLSKELLKTYLENIDKDIDILVKKLSDKPLDTSTTTLSELFDQMAMCETKKAKEALAVYLRKMQALYHKMLQNEKADKLLAFELVECMNRLVKLSEGHVLHSIEMEKPESMGRLFPLKHLQALTMQKANPNIIGSASLVNLYNAVENCKHFDPTKLGLPNTALSKLLMAVSAEGTREEYKKKWYNFLTKVYQKSGENGLNELRILLNNLRDLDLKTYWFNVTFQDYADPTMALIKNDIENEKNLFEKLKTFNTTLSGLQQSIPSWGDPEFYKKQIAKFDKAFQLIGFDDKNPPSIAVLYEKANKLGKAAILEFFHKAMEIYDESIKAVTGSGQFASRKEQAQAFAGMLDRYAEMLRASTQIAKPFQQEINKLDGMNASNSQKKHKLDQFETYLTYLKEKDFEIQRSLNNHSPDLTVYYGKCLNTFKKSIAKMTEEECNKLFEARENFNVSAVSLGSHTDLTFCIYWPRTLEELFTTYHQSMEALIKTMKTKVGMDKSRLPANIHALCDGIEKETKQSIAKMSVKNGILDVVYHVPFRSHASEIRIRTELNRPEKGYQLHMTVFGNEETNRWKTTGAFASLMAQLPGCTFLYGAKPKINYLNPVGMGVSFQYQITPEFKQASNFGALFKSLLLNGGITFDASDASPNGLIQGVSKLKGFTEAFPHLKKAADWLSLPQSFFSNTLFPNIFLLNTALSKNDVEAVKKIVKGTLFAMASFGHGDVTSNNVVSWSLFSQLFKSGGDKVTVSSLFTTYQNELPKNLKTKYDNNYSYRTALLFTIYHLCKTDYSAAMEVIQFLKMNPKTKNHFKMFIEDLDQIVSLMKQTVKDVKPTPSIIIPSTTPSPIPSTSTADKIEDKVVSGRKELQQKLEEIASSINTLGTQGMSKELVKESAKALIGLSQDKNFLQLGNCKAVGLEKYLGMEPFKKFLTNNNFSLSSKLYKAATFYILESVAGNHPGLIIEGENAIKNLIADYKQFGKDDVNGPQALNCLFTILAGYHYLHPKTANIPEFVKDVDLMKQFEAFWLKHMGAPFNQQTNKPIVGSEPIPNPDNNPSTAEPGTKVKPKVTTKTKVKKTKPGFWNSLAKKIELIARNFFRSIKNFFHNIGKAFSAKPVKKPGA